MRADRPGPPRILEWICAATLPWRQREVVLGDLFEEYADLAGRLGRPAASRWYATEVWRSLGPTLSAALRRTFSPRSYDADDLVAVVWAAAIGVIVTVALTVTGLS
ncbi:MAG: hypothetical protein R3195_17605 [Gemmatimonadota bacterium]|nr:hypothetical protein [Gemmatimonadota bacterium]